MCQVGKVFMQIGVLFGSYNGCTASPKSAIQEQPMDCDQRTGHVLEDLATHSVKKSRLGSLVGGGWFGHFPICQILMEFQYQCRQINWNVPRAQQ